MPDSTKLLSTYTPTRSASPGWRSQRRSHCWSQTTGPKARRQGQTTRPKARRQGQRPGNQSEEEPSSLLLTDATLSAATADGATRSASPRWKRSAGAAPNAEIASGTKAKADHALPAMDNKRSGRILPLAKGDAPSFQWHRSQPISRIASRPCNFLIFTRPEAVFSLHAIEEWPTRVGTWLLHGLARRSSNSC